MEKEKVTQAGGEVEGPERQRGARPVAETATRRRGAKQAMRPVGRSAIIEHREVPWWGIRGKAPSVAHSPCARSAQKKRAMFARSADEQGRLHGFELRWEVQEPQVPAKGF